MLNIVYPLATVGHVMQAWLRKRSLPSAVPVNVAVAAIRAEKGEERFPINMPLGDFVNMILQDEPDLADAL